MDLLLDSHVLLWWDAGDRRLNAAARERIADPANRVYISAAMPWEVGIKLRKGKLTLHCEPVELIEANGFESLPIDPRHGALAGSLDWNHPDPFDRVLVAQALLEKLVLVHADRAIRGFGVPQFWAG
jgi:PIN domain nuclease of toxin-antitoxin system